MSNFRPNTLLEGRYSLECAHRILGYKGKCARLHGHNYAVVLVLGCDSEKLEGGMVMDSAALDICVRPVFAKIDHRTILQDGDPLIAPLRADNPDNVFVLSTGEPTAENLAKFLFRRLAFLSHSGRQRLIEVRVEENGRIAARHPDTAELNESPVTSDAFADFLALHDLAEMGGPGGLVGALAAHYSGLYENQLELGEDMAAAQDFKRRADALSEATQAYFECSEEVPPEPKR